VLGIIPYDHSLRSVSVEEIVERLNGRVATDVPLNQEILYFRIGATGPEPALRSFRRTPELAVITGGDRIEIQEAALKAESLRCLILTGNHLPNREVVRKANERGVPVILVGQDPMAAAFLCEGALNRSRIHPGTRLDSVIRLVRFNVDIERIIEKASDQ
jgi:BioD-like phosphotransacetylase family protein